MSAHMCASSCRTSKHGRVLTRSQERTNAFFYQHLINELLEKGRGTEDSVISNDEGHETPPEEVKEGPAAHGIVSISASHHPPISC